MEWRQIPGFPAYRISGTGIVERVKQAWPRKRVCRFPKVIPPHYVGKAPYRRQAVPLYDEKGILHSRSVSVLVARTFLGEPPTPTDCVIHKDGNRDNHSAANLSWGRRSDVHTKYADPTRRGSSLSANIVVQIKDRYTGRRGELTYLAAEFGTTPQNVHLIVTGQRWADIAAPSG